MAFNCISKPTSELTIKTDKLETNGSIPAIQDFTVFSVILNSEYSSYEAVTPNFTHDTLDHQPFCGCTCYPVTTLLKWCLM